jgi:hypothetical protein
MAVSAIAATASAVAAAFSGLFKDEPIGVQLRDVICKF